MLIYTREVLQQRVSKDQEALTGRKLAVERPVMTTSQHVGVASSIWMNKARSFAVAWWPSNKFLANKGHTEARDAEKAVDGSWKSCTQQYGGEKQQGARSTAARQLIMEE